MVPQAPPEGIPEHRAMSSPEHSRSKNQKLGGSSHISLFEIIIFSQLDQKFHEKQESSSFCSVLYFYFFVCTFKLYIILCVQERRLTSRLLKLLLSFPFSFPVKVTSWPPFSSETSVYPASLICASPMVHNCPRVKILAH